MKYKVFELEGLVVSSEYSDDKEVSSVDEWGRGRDKNFEGVLYLRGGEAFPIDAASCILLLGIKEEWKWAFDTIAKVPSVKITFLSDEQSKEEGWYFDGGDGVTKLEGNLVLEMLSFSSAPLVGVDLSCLSLRGGWRCYLKNKHPQKKYLWKKHHRRQNFS